LMAYSDEAFDPYPDIKKVNVTTGKQRTVKRGTVGIEHWITDTNGTPRIGKGTFEDGTHKMVIFSTSTKKWENSKQYPELPSRISTMYSDITESDTGNVSAVRYTARDGQKIPAFVTFPPTVVSQEQLKSLPFIVLPHGGTFARDSKHFDYFAQFFAPRGYGVLQMNFSGSAVQRFSGYGPAFQEVGRNNWIVTQEDVEDGTRWLIEKGYADPEKTCIAGWS